MLCFVLETVKVHDTNYFVLSHLIHFGYLYKTTYCHTGMGPYYFWEFKKFLRLTIPLLFLSQKNACKKET